MRSLVLSVTATLAFAGAAFGQTSHTGANIPEVLRGKSAEPTTNSKKATPTKPAVHKVAAAQSTQRPAAQHSTPQRVTPQSLRAARYGGFAPFAAPPPPPPELDTSSPRTLNLVNENSGETLVVTYWSNGTYRRDALDQLNHFLRDTRENVQTEMDPLLFDVLWHTATVVGYGGPIDVLSAFRSPTTNAWLASVSRGVASDSQHMNGNAMDVRFPGVPVFKIRQAAGSLNMGGVGFYPRSGFVHLDTGPVRYW
jgi:uncharacterized protein YcbK (DUF882 family)